VFDDIGELLVQAQIEAFEFRGGDAQLRARVFSPDRGLPKLFRGGAYRKFGY
jgi:hypothetical protein